MTIERTYTIPLRKEFRKAPRYRRAKKAVNAVKAFLMKHMKADEKNLKLGKYLNLELWKHGMKNPPCRVRINVTKDEKGIVKAELVGAPEEKKEELKKGKKEAANKVEPKLAEKKEETKKQETPAEAKEEKTEEAKKPEVKKEKKSVGKKLESRSAENKEEVEKELNPVEQI